MKEKHEEKKKDLEKAEVSDIVDTLDNVIVKLKDWYMEEIEAPQGANYYYIKRVSNHVEIGYTKCELFC